VPVVHTSALSDKAAVHGMTGGWRA